MLTLRQAEMGYSGKPVLSIGELDIGESRITILIGRNGSGKSTLLRSVAGILPYRGQIRVTQGENEASVSSLSHRERARLIGLLPQSQPAPVMDVLTLVMHGRYSRISWPGRPGKKDMEAVNAAVDLCGIRDLKDRSLPRLSGGERQLCYLAMVIAQDPRIFLLDEPMSAMDIAHQTRIMKVLSSLRKKGKTVVMTSHDLPQSFTLADRIVLLGNGRVIGEGTPGELVKKPELVRETMGAALAEAEGEDLLYPYVLTV